MLVGDGDDGLVALAGLPRRQPVEALGHGAAGLQRLVHRLEARVLDLKAVPAGGQLHLEAPILARLGHRNGVDRDRGACQRLPVPLGQDAPAQANFFRAGERRSLRGLLGRAVRQAVDRSGDGPGVDDHGTVAVAPSQFGRGVGHTRVPRGLGGQWPDRDPAGEQEAGHW
jgi:hypothetical protein